MPLLTISYCDKHLTREQKANIAMELSPSFITALGVQPDNQTALSICRIEFSYINESDSFCGGMSNKTPFYRLCFYLPNSLSTDAIANLNRSCFDIFCRYINYPFELWLKTIVIEDGNWGKDGKSYSWRDIKRYVARGEIARKKKRQNELAH